MSPLVDKLNSILLMNKQIISKQEIIRLKSVVIRISRMALFPFKQKYSNLCPHNPASPWVILRIGCELDCCVQGNIRPLWPPSSVGECELNWKNFPVLFFFK